MIRLALLRHGYTAWNRAGRIQGRTDIPLDDEARVQLSGLRLPPPWDKAALVSSPLLRAVETAELVAGHPPAQEPALVEMNWGDWEGLHGKDLLDDPDHDYRHIEDWGWQFSPPNGESPETMRMRLEPWAESLRNDTIAVCHIGVMRVLMAVATGWHFSDPAPFAIKRNRLYVLEITPETWRVTGDPVRLLERVP